MNATDTGTVDPGTVDPNGADTQVAATNAIDVSGIRPTPTTLEAVAIVAALEALWPKPATGEEPDTDRSANWRFSGRWWRRDRMSDASRPWS